MTMPPARVLALSLAVAASVACFSADVSLGDPQPDLEELRAQVLEAEDAMNLAVDALDCETGMSTMLDADPIFVSSGRVIRTKAELRGMCDQMVAPRTGAVFSIDNRTATMLSDAAAVIVRDGMYTINYREGPSREVYLVMTTVWQLDAEGWKMVHLHESAPPPPPAGQ